MDILSMQNVSLSFGSTRALDGLSFAVKEGEIFGFLGPSGAGKTTVLNMLGGMDTGRGKNHYHQASHTSAPARRGRDCRIRRAHCPP